MATPRPTFMVNFANTPDYLDPRIQFLRNTTASYVNRQGLITYVPAGAPRWSFDPLTGECRGVMIEPTRTNILLQSEDFNTTWTKTNCSVTVNATVSPDGATTAERITVSTTNGQVSQVASVVSGNSISFSVFSKSDTQNFLRTRITDGSNTVDAWFNLLTMEKGTTTAGGATCSFASSSLESFVNGWSRCVLHVNTSTNTAYTFSLSAAPSDGGTPAAGNSVFVWGAQGEAPGTYFAETSYILTTTSTATRDADNFVVPIAVANDKWFTLTKGTIYFEWINNSTPAINGAPMIGGIADTFANTIYMARTAASSLTTNFISSTVGVSTSKVFDFSTGLRGKGAFTWGSSAYGFGVNGVAAVGSAVSPTPVSILRLSIGGAPYGSTNTSNLLYGAMRAVAYYPQLFSATELQTLTA